jgi:type I restriction enzyme R subunit
MAPSHGAVTVADPATQDSAGFASPNFGHLAKVVPLLALQGVKAERYVFDDPVTAVFRLRRFGEVLAQSAAARIGLFVSGEESQADLLRRLKDARIVDFEVADLFHALRKTGNDAVHEDKGTPRDALLALRAAWKLGVWFQRAFHDAAFKSGPFIPPPDPRQAEYALREELEQLRRAQAEAAAQVAELQATAQQEAALRAEAEAASRAAYRDVAVALDLAGETEAKAARLEAEFKARLAAEQAQAAAAPKPQAEAAILRVQRATEHLTFDESETRRRIDTQLREAGWEADTVAISYKAGVRPTKGKNLAIAEWPTSSGPADYVLFLGLTPVGIVEAKRRTTDVPGAIEQSKRYSRDYDFTGESPAPGAPWGPYQLPFLFATNGRAFLQQVKTKSGIWFLDARRATNHPRPLEGWYTPEGLQDLLSRDAAKADAKLAAEQSSYLPLRDYQHAAIAAAEQAIAQGATHMLLAMATGTGKTRLALCLVYRLLKAGRFRRILFLVDRTALGEQAHDAFQDVRLENLQTLTEIYDVKGLGDVKPEPDTRLHIATVQGMVKRLLSPSDADAPVPVDAYDCVVVDECHRGYALDLEMSGTQLEYRSEKDYISKYRRVLDHFDAVRIGLTATPALHTTEIFGKPIFEYGYRQAVVDGNLVDHEPPIRIQTKLNQEGIHWDSGETVPVYNTATGQLDLFDTPDEIDIDVEGFNTKVLTDGFNRVVCDFLARSIDPNLPGKTMVFCATDAHADIVVRLLKASLAEVYGEVEDDTVMKITGAIDRPLEKLRLFKNERLPKIAVTVDLLTTGIDVPEIQNLVFIRRVKSRILYDQMIGRGTRLCPDIGKEFFRIYDAVDLYAALEPYSAMKPVVTRPSLSFAQLVDELVSDAPDEAHKRSVVLELLAKFQVKKRRLRGEHHESFTALTGGRAAEQVIDLLKTRDTAGAIDFFRDHAALAPFLDRFKVVEGRDLYVYEGEDAFRGTERGYGEGRTRPEDYLAGFKAFIEAHRNDLAALMIVTQRPRDLTRSQLRELRLKLDTAGYPESALRTAWAQVSNQDIAASIIGFIRQQALGSALVPYDQRVDRALQRVLASQPFTPPQRQWLDRIGKQLKAEVIVDREALDQGQFKAQGGGFARLNKVFEGKLEQVLGTLHEELWNDVG